MPYALVANFVNLRPNSSIVSPVFCLRAKSFAVACCSLSVSKDILNSFLTLAQSFFSVDDNFAAFIFSFKIVPKNVNSNLPLSASGIFRIRAVKN